MRPFPASTLLVFTSFLGLKKLWLLWMIFAVIAHFVSAKKKLKEQDIIQRVLKDYDWRVRPRGNNDTWPGGLVEKLLKRREKFTIEKYKYTFMGSKKLGTHGLVDKTLAIHVIGAGSIPPMSKFLTNQKKVVKANPLEIEHFLYMINFLKRNTPQYKNYPNIPLIDAKTIRLRWDLNQYHTAQKSFLKKLMIGKEIFM
jgi:hypothetical protein